MKNLLSLQDVKFQFKSRKNQKELALKKERDLLLIKKEIVIGKEYVEMLIKNRFNFNSITKKTKFSSGKIIGFLKINKNSLYGYGIPCDGENLIPIYLYKENTKENETSFYCYNVNYNKNQSNMFVKNYDKELKAIFIKNPYVLRFDNKWMLEFRFPNKKAAMQFLKKAESMTYDELYLSAETKVGFRTNVLTNNMSVYDKGIGLIILE